MELLSEEDDCFFDAREEVASITSMSDSPSDSAESSFNLLQTSSSYDAWISNLESVQERRSKFLSLMGLGLDRIRSFRFSDPTDTVRINETSGAVLRLSSVQDEFSSSDSSPLNLHRQISLEHGQFGKDSRHRAWDLDDRTAFMMDQLEHNGGVSARTSTGVGAGTLCRLSSNHIYPVDEFQGSIDGSLLPETLMGRENARGGDLNVCIKRKRSKSWLRRLGSVSCVMDKNWEEVAAGLSDSDSNPSTRDKSHRVKVHSYKKRSKEFSAVFQGQEIEAHIGAILTMKFSPDGQYLASAGEDGIVKVWQVRECQSSDEDYVLDADPSCICFMLNNSKELTPVVTAKEKLGKVKGMGKKSDSACVILPPKVFQLSEKPVHEFHGHMGDVLDLSWSKGKYLLSSSVDNTVRLWRIGHDKCLKIFSHKNYVTCIQFNPVDENYFISGSIDGKVRIWAISRSMVVDWTDVGEIITAVSYRPNGQGSLVGSMTGMCRFYDASDNHLQLDAQVSLQGKKKSSSNRITGFQFSPDDPTKIMVTSADSQVRILDGMQIVCRYKGLRNTGSQISASFTSDGKHIVSASEDSNVYIWNAPESPHGKTTKSVWSCEHFFSRGVSVAISWSGMKPANSIAHASGGFESYESMNGNFAEDPNDNSAASCSDSIMKFSLINGFFSEPLTKGSATWPEEKLLAANKLGISPSSCKSHFKFLRNCCQSSLASNAWGMVIVTAGWDGRIRTFFNYGLPIRF